jgi:hypothetical protein
MMDLDPALFDDIDALEEERALDEAEAAFLAGRVISHDATMRWLASWGTPDELPRPPVGPRQPIDLASPRAVTESMPLQPESAADLVRAMRDSDRYEALPLHAVARTRAKNFKGGFRGLSDKC